MKTPMVFSIAICAVISGCTTSFHLSSAENRSEIQDVVFIKGNEVATSYKEETTVALLGERTERKEIYLTLFVQNNAKNIVHVDPKKLTVKAEDNGKQKPLKLYSPDEYARKVRRELMRQQNGQALGAATKVYNARNSTATAIGYSTPIAATYYSNENVNQPQIWAKNTAELKQTAALHSLLLTTTNQTLFMKHSLAPGQTISGKIVAKYAAADAYYISIPIGRDTHSFKFVPNL